MKSLLPSPPTPERKTREKKLPSQQPEHQHMRAIFSTVGYQARTEEQQEEVENSASSVFNPNMRSKLTEGKVNLVKFIQENYLIPQDFETNTKFGPYSGVCFEDRLTSCYEWKMFSPREHFKAAQESKKGWKMCWKCQEKQSHLAREGCPNEEI
jgi:hypothetical protein